MKPTSARLAMLFAIALIGIAVLIMRTGIFGGKQSDYRTATMRPRRERLDTAALPHSTPSKMTGRAFIRRNIPVLGYAHTVFVDDATGRLQIVASQNLNTDGSYDIKIADNMLPAFAGILIELPGHGFSFLDRDTCKQPDVDLQLVFADVPEYKPADGKLAILVDDAFPLDVTRLIAKWTPVLQQRLGAVAGTSFIRISQGDKGVFFHNGLTKEEKLRKVTGQVTGVNGEPVATNLAVWLGTRTSGPGLLTVETKRDGRFEFDVDSDASVTVGVWDPARRYVSEQFYVAASTVNLVAKPAGIADVLVNEGGSGEPVQGLQFDVERQADMYNGNKKPGGQSGFYGSQLTDPGGHARLLLPVGTYSLVVRDATTKGGIRWEIPERRVSVKPGGPAARVQLRATRMRARTLVPVQGVNPQ